MANAELMDCVLALLTPLLLAAGAITDPALARRAALQAIEAYAANGQTPLLTAAQITGFALTALDNLRLSVDQSLPLTTKLRLRANANALGRSARQHSGKPAHSQPRAPEPAASNPAAPEPATPPPPQPTEQQNRLDWSTAMAETVKDLQTNTAQVTPAQHQTNQLWISVLTNVANELRQPPLHAPRTTKAELLRSTLMAGNPDFAAHPQNPIRNPAKPATG